ncbi:MAG: D-alanyl-D-alanine carboxypeptidase/D-alanyl-D-alanine-endopeptidase [Bacteroidia bacterium]|nr:D-alanyl-D-alanine carboxypeptidase/D-alanyl-D-alanine-endopeptidase [Bacteroidia bacterium]
MKKKGISVSQSPTTIRILRSQGKIMGNKRKTISTLYSPSLKYLVDLTNKYSINLYAEHFLYQLGKQKFPQGGVFEGAKAVEAFLQSIGIDTKGLFINDGSGLSRYNSITVKQITDLLKYMQVKSSCSDEFVNSLSVAGINGTLKKFFKGTAAENNLRGKTGSMTRVRGCAGYVTTKSKRKLAFAVIINNYSYEETEIDKIIERLLVKLAELNI